MALLLTGLACNAQNRIDQQGRKQGHWIKTDKNGVKIFEGDFKDGMETGTFQYFYPDGTLRIKNTFDAGGKTCKHEAYDEKGRLLATGRYNQKNRDGEWRFFNENGKLVKIANYKMGIKQGTHVVFTSTGDTAEVCNWYDNHRNGRWWKKVGTDGYITANYSKGSIDGRLVAYEKGQMTREGFYRNGVKNGSYKYFEEGRLAIDENWVDGILIDRSILVMVPDAEYVSVYNIAYFVPQGKEKVVIYMKDGSKMVAQESADAIYGRIGNELFGCANAKGRIMVATSCVKGLTHDSEGREILDLDPQPDFAIFPDDDCKKMISASRHNATFDEE